MGNYFFLIVIVAMFGLMWWMNRNQKKRQQEQQNKLNTMPVGSNIITIGGLHGVLHSVGETTVDIDCEGVILTFEKNAIRTFNAPTTASATDERVEDKKEDVIDNPIEEK